MPKSPPPAVPGAVTAYMDAAPEPARSRLRALADVIRGEAPEANERIAYGLATWHQGENLIHLGAFKQHVGIYPGSAAIAYFADDLAGFKTSKGAIQLPHDAPIPTELVRRITRWRVEQVAAKAATQAEGKAKPMNSERRVGGSSPVATKTDITSYNASRSDEVRALCDVLADLIAQSLPGAESKIWHGHPVWFLEQNPIVGYSTHKDGIRLLFWSGQSFDEPALSPVGKFKAAETRYSAVEELDAGVVRRWLEKAQSIQWDYKNVVKNKGLLQRFH